MTFKSKIVITPNETRLIKEMEKQKFPFEIENGNLDTGDIHLRGVGELDEEVLYIIERKEGKDLNSSIKDGRYRDQKSRMLATGLDANRIIYIMENIPHYREKGITQQSHKAMMSAITNSIVRDKLTVYQTKNIEETAFFLESLRKSVDKHFLETNKEGQEICSVKVCDTKIKKKKVNPGNWFKYSLMLIPGVSEDISNTITKKYKYPEELICAYEKSKDPQNLLKTMKRSSVSKISIGKVISERIYRFMME